MQACELGQLYIAALLGFLLEVFLVQGAASLSTVLKNVTPNLSPTH